MEPNYSELLLAHRRQDRSAKRNGLDFVRKIQQNGAFLLDVGMRDPETLAS